MLVLTRKSGQSIYIGDKIKIKVLSIGSSGVELGIEAPKEISIVREELLEKVKDINIKAAQINTDSLDIFKKLIKNSKLEEK